LVEISFQNGEKRVNSELLEEGEICPKVTVIFIQCKDDEIIVETQGLQHSPNFFAANGRA